jgi:uncharacterized protein (DUF1501 family)
VLAAAIGVVGWSRTALAQLAVSPGPPGRDVLVVVFLRGGADGLNIVTPYREDGYYRARPSLGIPRPQAGVGEQDRLIELDGFFGLNPALAPLRPSWDAGELAFVHAVGSQDESRSHFEAMNAMERGLARSGSGAAGGWLARHLASTEGSGSPLRAVAFGGLTPDSLQGGTHGLAITSLDDFRLSAPPGGGTAAQRWLENLYGKGDDELTSAGRETLAVLESIRRLDPATYRPAAGASYPDSDLGRGLRQVALLIKAELGLEVACLDHGGYDTHVAQGTTSGWLTGNLLDLGRSIAAFAADLGDRMARVTVVVQTEFGRRLGENSGLGTDHGRSGVMMLLGGGVRGGKVHGPWPTLERDALDEYGDLRVATDYREVLADVVRARLANPRVEDVFPGYRPGGTSFVREALAG